MLNFSKILSVVLAATLVAISNAQAATQCAAQSGAHTVALLELYTSEGCSSCPPTDTWVSKLPAAGFNRDRVIPLALHVDYWDYIGWKDRYANPAYSGRQREMARVGGAGFVYTPQVMLSGKDFRGSGSNTRLGETVNSINQKPPKASIALALARNPASPQSLELSGNVTVANVPDRANAQVYVAIYENGLHSEVKAGENRGEKLSHDYVVRELVGPLVMEAGGRLNLMRHLNLKPEWKTKDSGVAVFVQNSKTGEVLQALALPLCSG